MKANVRLFFILGVFFVIADVIYTVWTRHLRRAELATDPSGGAPQAQVEWVGTVGIGLTAILAFFIAFYLSRSHAAQGGELPEDRLDANIDDGDPELGFYSPWSWWPLVLGPVRCARLHRSRGRRLDHLHRRRRVRRRHHRLGLRVLPRIPRALTSA